MTDDTSMREQIFQFIVDFKREHDGLSPKWQEIADAVLVSKTTVRYHLQQLQIEGRVQLIKRRGIAVEGGMWNLIEPDDERGDQASGDSDRPSD
jgi:predicted ArsR family transcriptional regulator